MNNMKKNVSVFKAILLTIIIISPILLLAAAVFFTPPQYTKTFLGELKAKYDYLYSVEEPKIVVVGGSSTAFGLDSEILSEYTGKRVVNFGLYATLGTKVMLDLSEDAVKEGDIIIIAPEMDAQTLSLYFNGEAVWQGVESDWSMLLHLDRENLGEMLGSSVSYATSKLKFMKIGAPDPSGVYNRASFNEYGDIIYPRPENIMSLGYDPNTIINLSPSIIDDKFIDYINAYVKKAEKKGAIVYFSFPPMNSAALAPETTDESVLEFYDYISKALDCKVISNINDYITDPWYFYDSNFHANDAGVILHTSRIIEDLQRQWSNTALLDIDIPKKPDGTETTAPGSQPGDTTDPEDKETIGQDADCFTYGESGSGLMVTGLSEKGKSRTELAIPEKIEGKRVISVGEGAFAESKVLVSVTINDNIEVLMNGVFAGCATLKNVYLNTTPAKTNVSNDGFLNGASKDIKLWVAQASYSEFVTNYFWGPYGDYYEIMK